MPTYATKKEQLRAVLQEILKRGYRSLLQAPETLDDGGISMTLGDLVVRTVGKMGTS